MSHSQWRVYKLLRERGLPRAPSENGILREARRKCQEYAPRGNELVPPDFVAEVVERYQAGETAPALAKAFGLKQCRVYMPLHEQGVVRSQSNAVKLEQRRQLAEWGER